METKEKIKKCDHGWFSDRCLSIGLLCIFSLLLTVPSASAAPLPGGTQDPTLIPKYVIPLVIPPEMPKSTASQSPAADYDIAVRQFKQQILPGGLWDTLTGRHDALPATTLWSYGRAEDEIPAGFTAPVPVDPASSLGILGQGVSFNYPAFTVENISMAPTTVRWINDLVDPVTGNYLPHLFSVDQTLHWANPPTANCMMGNPNRTDCETMISTPYTGPVPLVTHVHGAHVQPHSDGYPEAWWLPGANNIPAGYSLHGSVYTQADNSNAVAGSAFYSYENSQPATTIWYHDHALGMTRLNVYAGPAGFWLIRGGDNGDSFVDDGTTVTANDGVLPGPAPSGAGDPNFDAAYRNTIREIPVAIQDRSFNDDGSLFYPAGRDFFDGFTGPYITNYSGAWPSDISAIWNPEAFFNTMVVNGTTWPVYEVGNGRYRLRLLNGCNSRTLNLSLFVVTNNPNGIPGDADDEITPPQEIPFYQIGGDQGFLPQVIKIVTGFVTTLPGDGTTPASVPAPDSVQALLMGPAERADVIVDFSALADGTRIRMINTAPDGPFGGFPDAPADPSTTGQVMDFVVNSALTTAFDATTTPVENLVLPAEAQLGPATKTRRVSLNEMVSDQVCVEINPVDGSIVRTLFSIAAGDANFLAYCTNYPVAAGNIADAMGPRQALLGTLVTDSATGSLIPVQKKWGDPVTEVPILNSTETWEIYNTTMDAHPIHLHLVRYEVVNRQDIDPATLLPVDGTLKPALPNEEGYKDTVVAYPGQVTRIKTKFDIAGLYVWHCHIVEHEDNEMMRPYFVNATGKTGIYWRNSSTGENMVWYMNETKTAGKESINSISDQDWKLAGAADFNGDGDTDILWRNNSTGENAIWLQNGSTTVEGVLLNEVPDLNWNIAGTGDFNKDGTTDILWRNIATGENAIWFMNNTTVTSGALINPLPDLNWQIGGAGDFDSDGNADIIWRNISTGENAIWFMDNADVKSGQLFNTVPDLNWQIAGTCDLNIDGKTDILWRDGATGENAVWFMNGGTVMGGAMLEGQTDLNWQIAGK